MYLRMVGSIHGRQEALILKPCALTPEGVNSPELAGVLRVKVASSSGREKAL
jgi:hypothetical protein